MNRKNSISLKCAVALILALLFALPAIGEEVVIDLEGGIESVTSEAENLEIEELPELSEDIDLTVDIAETDVVEENDSKPIQDFQEYTYKQKLKGNASYTINLQDDLYITTPEADIVRWQNDDDVVAKVSRYKKEGNNCLFVKPLSVGTTVITIRLANQKVYRYTLTVKDGYALTKFSLSEQSATLRVGQDIDLKQFFIVEPGYAKYNIRFQSSDKNIGWMSKDGVLTARKPGKITVTFTANYRFREKMSVVVKANRTDALEAEPTQEDIGQLEQKWTLWPKTLELKGNGSIVCNLWLLNDSQGKLSALNNLDMAISLKDDTSGTLIARSSFKSVKVDCAKNKSQAISLTFPAKSVSCPQDFTMLKSKNLSFMLYGTPGATGSGSDKNPAYQPTSILINDNTPKNPVKYRALLISESDFYHPSRKDPEKRWERINRNKGDVELMKKMLSNVKTPDGGKYEVTTQDNTSLDQIKELIRKTYAGADENDVSLFFIATHGDSSDSAKDEDCGSLRMASLSETNPEWLDLFVLRDLLLKVPGKVIVILESCGSGAAVVKSNDGSDTKEALIRSAEAFDAQVIETFRSADPGLSDSEYAANTGELRRVNKFYVLTASACREESWGRESSVAGKNGYNVFTRWLVDGVGKSGSMPADTQFAGNNNGVVDLHELYRYISGVGDRSKNRTVSKKDVFFYQHVQVYPSNLRYILFK